MAGIKISELDAATSLAGTELIPLVQSGANKTITPFFLNGNVYNVRWFGATGDGVTNDSTAIQTAITAAIAAGKPLYFPAGTYLATALTVTGALTIFGDGDQSVIKTTANAILFNVSAAGFRMYDLQLLGNSTGTSQFGVYINAVSDYLISRCKFYLLQGGGVRATGTIAITAYGGTISDCKFFKCAFGVRIDNRHEFVNLLNNNVNQCTTMGYYILAGNFNITGGSINKNSLGIYVLGGTNDSHSTISSVLVNHNGTALLFSGLQYGMTVSGCQFHDGLVHIKDSDGILFNGCEFGADVTINLENDESHFANCVIRTPTIVPDYNSTTSHTLWTGTITVGEVNPIFKIQAETDTGSAILMTNKTGDEKYRLYANGTQKIAQLSAALTDGAPTDAEIDSATGLTPATAGAGWKCVIKDSNGSGLCYLVESDGTAWHYWASTIAS